MKLGWWNTKIAPPPRSEASDASLAASTTIFLLIDEGCSLIGLSEISPAGLAELEGSLRRGAHGAWRSLHCEQRNLGLLFDSSHWSPRSEASRIVQSANRHVHAGWVISCRTIDSGALLRLVLLHWRTDLFNGAIAREDCGRHLQAVLKEAPDTPTVLLGDFNCEPFDEVVTRHLGATRDVRMVAAGRAAFFNPFWHATGSSWATLRLREWDPVQLSEWKMVDFGVVNGALLPYEPSGEVVSVGEMTSDHLPVILHLGESKEHSNDIQ
ncbi:MAG: hypothetical protein Q8N26_38215 [Myxococcales bacterium]|nr:hypothetical protein [Myxococcales bacterium]